MLELENLIEVRKGSGIYITDLPHQKDGYTDNGSLNAAGPFELLQARQLLESNIAEFAATQATPVDIANMRSALQRERDELKTGKMKPATASFTWPSRRRPITACWWSY